MNGDLETKQFAFDGATGNSNTNFLTWTSYDMFLNKVARAVVEAITGQRYDRRHYCVNTADSRESGVHWVSIVIEIQRRDLPLLPAAAANVFPVTIGNGHLEIGNQYSF